MAETPSKTESMRKWVVEHKLRAVGKYLVIFSGDLIFFARIQIFLRWFLMHPCYKRQPNPCKFSAIICIFLSEVSPFSLSDFISQFCDNLFFVLWFYQGSYSFPPNILVRLFPPSWCAIYSNLLWYFCAAEERFSMAYWDHRLDRIQLVAAQYEDQRQAHPRKVCAFLI